jgi:anti-sigma factor RsiW
VSHLGDELSALVDGELGGAELDRANAHLAACGACRVEANALRRLKHELHALAEVHDSDEITSRLLAMISQAGPADPVSARRLGRARGKRGKRGRSYRRGMADPYAPLLAGRPIGRRRGRYVLWSAVSLVVVGIGTAAFGMGGGAPSPAGPRITPQLEVFDIQHAITSGGVPFAGSADLSARVPVGAATP